MMVGEEEGSKGHQQRSVFKTQLNSVSWFSSLLASSWASCSDLSAGAQIAAPHPQGSRAGSLGAGQSPAVPGMGGLTVLQPSADQTVARALILRAWAFLSSHEKEAWACQRIGLERGAVTLLAGDRVNAGAWEWRTGTLAESVDLGTLSEATL